MEKQENQQNWQEKMGFSSQNNEESGNSKENSVSENDQKINENSDSNLDEKNTNLENLLNQEKEKSSSLNDKLLRTLAELDNVRRRSREDLEKATKYAVSTLVSDLVLVAENFFLACDNLPKETTEKCPQTKNFVEAVIMTKKELVKILEKNNVKRIYPLNEKFDHHFHEAISYIESDSEKDSIVQVIQAGYVISERLIRPSLVVLSKGKN